MGLTVLWLIVYVTATILLACLGCFLLFVGYILYVHKSIEHIPSPPRSSFILGHLADIWKYKAETGRTAAEYLLEKRFQCGPIFVVVFVHRALVYLGDPSYIRHVYINNHKSLSKVDFLYDKLGFVYGERVGGYGLVTNTNEAVWRKRRRIMNPAFHRKCLRNFMGDFNSVCDRFLARIDAVVDSGKPTSMVSEFAKIALEGISQVSFNINTHAIESADSPFPDAIRLALKGIQDNLEIPLSRTFLKVFQFSLFQNHTKKQQIHAIRFLRQFAYECIMNRKKDIENGIAVPDDLLSLLIKDGSLTTVDIIDEFITVFIAGQETTANSLAFVLFEIINNPHVESKLLDEVNEVLGDRNYIEFDDLAKLKYVGQVLDEGHRLHTVAIAPARYAVKELTVGGYHIPKGVCLNSNQLFFAMNPEIWKNPRLFNPDRFSNIESIPNFTMTHFPFSIGPRNCIGQGFAKLESKVVLAKLLRRFQFKLLPGQTDRMEARLTITPKDGVMCNVVRRE